MINKYYLTDIIFIMEVTIKDIYDHCNSKPIINRIILNIDELLLKEDFNDETINFLNIILEVKHLIDLPYNKISHKKNGEIICSRFVKESLSKHYSNFIKLSRGIIGRNYPFTKFAIESIKSTAFILSELSNCELFGQFCQIDPIKKCLSYFCENIHLTLNIDTREVENYEQIEKSINYLEDSHNGLFFLLPPWTKLMYLLIHYEYSEEILNMDKYEDAVDRFKSMLSINNDSINLDIISISLIISDNLYRHCPKLIIMQKIKEFYTAHHTFLKNHYLARPDGYLYNQAKYRFYSLKIEKLIKSQ